MKPVLQLLWKQTTEPRTVVCFDTNYHEVVTLILPPLQFMLCNLVGQDEQETTGSKTWVSVPISVTKWLWKLEPNKLSELKIKLDRQPLTSQR